MHLKTSFHLQGDVQLRVADFRCGSEQLAASLVTPACPSPLGVVIVVGGPQYRVGAHRQLLELGSRFARAGYAALSFDPRGFGDSEGEARGYHRIHEEIRGAVDRLLEATPEVERVVLWGLCDGATACTLYAASDHRVAGMILVNPWLEPTRSHAQSRLKDYYGSRLTSGAFWSDLLRGRLDAIAAGKGVLKELAFAAGLRRNRRSSKLPSSSDIAQAAAEFDGPVHLILSGRDVTAKAFTRELETSAAWARLAKRRDVTRHDVEGADHTFSMVAWQEQMLDDVVQRLQAMERQGAPTGSAPTQG